jgi:LmbE family N-acetylglucosaminyl deacetylase
MIESMPALFIFPHPDDEFAVSAWIRDRRRSSTRVVCAYITDGAFGGQSPRRREAETIAALKGLSVPEQDILFLGAKHGIADGSLHLNLEQALDLLVPVAGSLGKSVELFCPAWEGGHQDHDAAHVLALALAARLGAGTAVSQFPLYTGARLPGPFFRVMHPLALNGRTRARRCNARERLSQIRFCFGYPSQWKTWMGLLPFVVWHMLADGKFYLQSVDVRRVLEPPHAGSPLYSRRGFLSEADFRTAVAPFIERHVAQGTFHDAE